MTIKGHIRKRVREWQRKDQIPSEQTGKPNLPGWQQLAVKFGEMGYAVQAGGERFVQA